MLNKQTGIFRVLFVLSFCFVSKSFAENFKTHTHSQRTNDFNFEQNFKNHLDDILKKHPNFSAEATFLAATCASTIEQQRSSDLKFQKPYSLDDESEHAPALRWNITNLVKSADESRQAVQKALSEKFIKAQQGLQSGISFVQPYLGISKKRQKKEHVLMMPNQVFALAAGAAVLEEVVVTGATIAIGWYIGSGSSDEKSSSFTPNVIAPVSQTLPTNRTLTSSNIPTSCSAVSASASTPASCNSPSIPTNAPVSAAASTVSSSGTNFGSESSNLNVSKSNYAPQATTTQTTAPLNSSKPSGKTLDPLNPYGFLDNYASSAYHDLISNAYPYAQSNPYLDINALNQARIESEVQRSYALQNSYHAPEKKSEYTLFDNKAGSVTLSLLSVSFTGPVAAVVFGTVAGSYIGYRIFHAIKKRVNRKKTAANEKSESASTSATIAQSPVVTIQKLEPQQNVETKQSTQDLCGIAPGIKDDIKTTGCGGSLEIPEIKTTGCGGSLETPEIKTTGCGGGLAIPQETHHGCGGINILPEIKVIGCGGTANMIHATVLIGSGRFILPPDQRLFFHRDTQEEDPNGVFIPIGTGTIEKPAPAKTVEDILKDTIQVKPFDDHRLTQHVKPGDYENVKQDFKDCAPTHVQNREYECGKEVITGILSNGATIIARNISSSKTKTKEDKGYPTLEIQQADDTKVKIKIRYLP